MKNVYFIGIGGIGMSALARYFKFKGYEVSGYDRTPSELTGKLIQEGIPVHYEDLPQAIPADVPGRAPEQARRAGAGDFGRGVADEALRHGRRRAVEGEGVRDGDCPFGGADAEGAAEGGERVEAVGAGDVAGEEGLVRLLLEGDVGRPVLASGLLQFPADNRHAVALRAVAEDRVALG